MRWVAKHALEAYCGEATSTGRRVRNIPKGALVGSPDGSLGAQGHSASRPAHAELQDTQARTTTLGAGPGVVLWACRPDSLRARRGSPSLPNSRSPGGRLR